MNIVRLVNRETFPFSFFRSKSTLSIYPTPVNVYSQNYLPSNLNKKFNFAPVTAFAFAKITNKMTFVQKRFFASNSSKFKKSLNLRDKNGNTILHWVVNLIVKSEYVKKEATTNRNYLVCQSLLHMGADPNIPDVNNYTPLQTALKTHNIALITLLLNFGAGLSFPNGTTAFQATNNPEILALLKNYQKRFRLPNTVDD